MSGSNRGRYAAAIGASFLLSAILFGIAAYIYGLGYGSAQYQVEANTYTDHNTSDTEKRVGDCFSSTTVQSEIGPCVAEVIKAGRESERGESDLKAQRDMAEWAFGMLLVSAAGVFVTSVGTALLLWQIRLTQKAVSDTGLATKAMNEANRIAQIQTRAYLVAGEHKIDPSVFPDGTARITLHIAVKNSGTTIAVKVISRYYTIIARKGDTFPDCQIKSVSDHNDIPPNGIEYVTSYFDLNKEDVRKFKKSIYPIYFRYIFDYKTVYGAADSFVVSGAIDGSVFNGGGAFRSYPNTQS